MKAAADLTSCDREPIHLPGSIQPHGVLLALRDGGGDAGWRVAAVSANAAEHLGRRPEHLLGLEPQALLGTADARRVLDLLQRPGGQTGSLGLRLGGRDWLAVTHAHAGLGFVELEPAAPPAAFSGALPELAAANGRLQGTEAAAQACQVTAEAARALSGFDRVMVYRFAADWSGEVLGEARDAAMAAYLGLHFPASDIPVQARALYLANPLRLIADAAYAPSPLIADRSILGDAPIDLSFSTLRSVSPVHLEYLRNMGVAASMSVSIIRGGALWGLIACHHRTTLPVGFEARQACHLLAGMLAGQLQALDRVAAERGRAAVTALHASMLEGAVAGDTTGEALLRHGASVLALVEASGWALVSAGAIARCGDAPDDAALRDLARWIGERNGPAEPFATDRLGEIHPPAAASAAQASGVLAVKLSGDPPGAMLWFRGEQARYVTWAGEPAKAVRPAAYCEEGGEEEGEQEGEARLHPRLSFAAWTEQVRGRSQPWTAPQIAAAWHVRALLLELGAGERDALARRNASLARSNQELETFIYVASHDIKEPLRQMEMLAGMLADCTPPERGGEVAEYTAEFSTLATRLRRLTEELANYARPGRSGLALSPVRLDEVVEEVLVQLRGRIAEAGAQMQVGTLPLVLGERAQLHQVFVNLIGNALKYREPARTLTIAITAAREGDGQFTRIEIADNGIGFEAKYATRVFDAFARLHPRDRYEGSGLGLAICRRIVERHGGSIQARGEPDAGACFSFTLQTPV